MNCFVAPFSCQSGETSNDCSVITDN